MAWHNNPTIRRIRECNSHGNKGHIQRNGDTLLRVAGHRTPPPRPPQVPLSPAPYELCAELKGLGGLGIANCISRIQLRHISLATVHARCPPPRTAKYIHCACLLNAFYITLYCIVLGYVSHNKYMYIQNMVPCGQWPAFIVTPHSPIPLTRVEFGWRQCSLYSLINRI